MAPRRRQPAGQLPPRRRRPDESSRTSDQPFQSWTWAWLLGAAVAAMVLLFLLFFPTTRRDNNDHTAADPLAACDGLVDLRRLDPGAIPAAINAVGSDGQTPVHSLLQRRFSSSAHVAAFDPAARHEDCVAAIAGVAGYDPEAGSACALSWAVHFRNLPALRALLQAGDSAAVRRCLSQRDAFNQTVLHVAATSKAAGLARLFLSVALSGGSPAAVSGIETVLDVRAAVAAPASTAVLALRDMEAAVGVGDLKALLASGAPVDARDGQGRTALMLAARDGRLAAVRLLLDSGADPRAVDATGATALHHAIGSLSASTAGALVAAGADAQAVDSVGRSAAGLVRGLGRAMPGQGSPAPRVAAAVGLSPAGENTADPTWSPAACARVDGSSIGDYEEFKDRFGPAPRPMILTGSLLADLTRSSDLFGNLPDSLAASPAGRLKVATGTVPYEELYRSQPPTAPTTVALADYLAALNRTNPADRPPAYVFDGQVLWRDNDLGRLFRQVPAFLRDAPVSLRQLMVGGAGTGSPPHFHGAAFNALVTGAKKWHLWAPPDAFFAANVSAMAWFDDRGPPRQPLPTYVCRQEAGEVLFVPRFWGHAVINTETSIAYAVEVAAT